MAIFAKTLPLCAAVAIVAGCAAEVVRHPAELAVQPAARRVVQVLGEAVSWRLDSGYQRQLAAGTDFLELGAIPQGRVLRPRNATLTVEGAHVHEAYAVVQSGHLVGFYLPVEKSFTPLSQPVPLSLHERELP